MFLSRESVPAVIQDWKTGELGIDVMSQVGGSLKKSKGMRWIQVATLEANESIQGKLN